MASSAVDTILFKAEKICKSFVGVRVLSDVDLTVRKGEVHALMGENGAGKSTLIKIITGAYTKDSGTLYYNGKQVEINGCGDSQRLGISPIYQELSLVPALTVAENVLLGREETNRLGMVRKKQRQTAVEALIKRYRFDLRPTDIVENLSIAHRQMVEILKALSLNASLLIMDEPTASLTTTESRHLFQIIRELSGQGVSILYISHRMEEIHELADVITVLRDGKRIGTYKKSDVTPEDIIRHMLGKALQNERSYAAPSANTGKKPILRVEELVVPGVLDGIRFSVYPGEIVGLSGLMGAGRTETLQAIFGANPSANAKGRFLLEGVEYRGGSIDAAISAGIGFVPEDRRIEGFVPMLSVRQNITGANLDWINRFGFFTAPEAERKTAEKAVARMNIKPADPETVVLHLSGGNQQKVVLGKWFARDLKLLLVDEPTAGVDVGAKDEIYTLLHKLLAQGVGILLASSDLTELLRLSGRILVLRNGKIVKEYPGGSVNEEQLLAAASGLETEVRP